MEVNGMHTISLTASRDGWPPPVRILAALGRLPRADRYVTGACKGGDAFTGSWLHARYPQAAHVVVVPANRAQADPWWRRVPAMPPVQLIEMPAGSTYRDRNALLVTLADEVAGFPAWPEDDSRSRRSGTWQAIRMARQAGRMGAWHCVLADVAGTG